MGHYLGVCPADSKLIHHARQIGDLLSCLCGKHYKLSSITNDAIYNTTTFVARLVPDGYVDLLTRKRDIEMNISRIEQDLRPFDQTLHAVDRIEKMLDGDPEYDHIGFECYNSWDAATAVLLAKLLRDRKGENNIVHDLRAEKDAARKEVTDRATTLERLKTERNEVIRQMDLISDTKKQIETMNMK